MASTDNHHHRALYRGLHLEDGNAPRGRPRENYGGHYGSSASVVRRHPAGNGIGGADTADRGQLFPRPGLAR